MNKVFVDTAAWIALLNVNDTWHVRSVQLRVQLTARNYVFVTSNFVLLEVADALCSPVVRASTTDFLRNINLIKSIQVVSLSDDLFRMGLSLYESRLDKDWGLTDCISFVVMQQEGIMEAFTTDKHFEQAGFIRLLK
ncbi:MAG: PIN domain-containing protein [Cyanobacteria bacterium P01_E01_bin.42]